MKKILFALLLTMAFSCKKEDQPMQGVNKYLVEAVNSYSANGDAWRATEEYLYGEDNRLKQFDFNENIEIQYNADGDINQIIHLVNPGNYGTYTYKINYDVNHLPLSGSRRYSYSPSSKESSPLRVLDSVSYKTVNREVTEIKFFDRKEYNMWTGALYSSSTDTSSKYTINYLNGNIQKIKSSEQYGKTIEQEFTYGTKKGVLSAARLKFFLDPIAPVRLYALNELLKHQVNIPKENLVKETIYEYSYDEQGYPLTSKVSGSGVSNNYSQVFKYKLP